MKQTASLNQILDLLWMLVEGFQEDCIQLPWSSHMQTVYHHRSARCSQGEAMVSIDSLCWSAGLEMLRQEVVLFAFYFWVAGGFWFVRSLNPCCAAGGEDHVVLFPGSDTFLCGLTDSPKKQFTELSPRSLDARLSELAWRLAASVHAQLRNLWFIVLKHWRMCLFLTGLPESWAALELTLSHTLRSRCIMCLLPLLTVYPFPN